jgi:hypothetical protein
MSAPLDGIKVFDVGWAAITNESKEDATQRRRERREE